MAMPQGNVVISSDKMQFPTTGTNNGDIQHRQWFMDERDRFISWLRGEFAAANALIDALCLHLRSIGDPGEYDVVMNCINQRRCNWNPVLHMQQYFSVAEVQYALQQATWKKQQRHFDKSKDLKKSGSRQWFRVDLAKENHNSVPESYNRDVGLNQSAVKGLEKGEEEIAKSEVIKKENEVGKPGEQDSASVEEKQDSNVLGARMGDRKNTDTDGSKVCGSTGVVQCTTSKPGAGNDEGTTNWNGQCDIILKSGSDLSQKQDENQNLVPVPKTFVATEIFDGKAVNVVEGLKLYEKLFDSSEISRLVQLVNELRSAGRRGQLQGQSFVISKRPIKGRGREIIQLGLPIAEAPQEDDMMAGTTEDRKIEPIPIFLKDVIERIVSSQITTVKPDSCIIDFFNEGDHSQPHMCPPWFGRPVCILFLTECDMTFGRVIGIDHPGDYRGPMKLSLLPGSLLALQGKSTDFSRYAISSVRKQRILVTFTKCQTKKTMVTEGHRLPSSALAPPMAWGAPPNRGPSHVRHPASTKHYGPVAATGVLPVPSMQQQHALPPSSMQPAVFVTSPVAPAMPYPAAVPLPPTSSGWAAVPAPRHPAPRPPLPGTGVFLPPPGSGPPQSSPQQLSATAPHFIMPAEKLASIENDNKSETLSCNANTSPKGNPTGNSQTNECNGSNGSALCENVVGKEEKRTSDLKKFSKQAAANS